MTRTRRRSPYDRAESEARQMHWRGERAKSCVLNAGHDWHVMRTYFRGDYRDMPCGGGSKAVDKDADFHVWDRG